MGTRARAVMGVLALALWALAGSASARDVWTAPYEGVRHLHRYGGGVDLHVIVVDLHNPAVSVVATRPEDRFLPVPAFARRYHTQVAINANFYRHDSCGLAVGDGQVFQGAYEDGCGASLGFGRENQAEAFDSLSLPRGPVPEAWMTEVLTGKPWIMRDGVAAMNWVRPQHLYRPNPRTVAGLSRDRRTLVLLTADGRRPGVQGVTGFELVRVLREVGCWDAINLDGGGSTTLVMGSHVINRPSDGTLRSVATHLGIRVRPGARWYSGELVSQSAPSEATEDEVVPVWTEVRNTGRSTWAPDEARSPRLVVEDGATTWTAPVASATPPGAVGRFELQWRAQGAGQRTLRARLVGPDGEVLAPEDVSFALGVRPRGPTERAALEGLASGGAGAAGFSGAETCSVASPDRPAVIAPGVAGMVGMAVAMARRHEP